MEEGRRGRRRRGRRMGSRTGSRGNRRKAGGGTGGGTRDRKRDKRRGSRKCGPVVVTAEDDPHNVFPDVVHVPLHRRQHDRRHKRTVLRQRKNNLKYSF